MHEYPKWVAVDGPGHPQNPGFVLVDNEEQERAASEQGKGPADLNPPPDAGQKALADMDRDELKQVLLREGIPDDMTDDDIRSAIEHGRERRAEHQRQDAEDAKHDAEVREAGGDHGDGLQTADAPKGNAEPGKDAEGNAIPPDTADEANKVTGDDATRTAPAAASSPATDSRSDEAKEKAADDAPAGNVTEAAATPPKHKRGAATTPGKA